MSNIVELVIVFSSCQIVSLGLTLFGGKTHFGFYSLYLEPSPLSTHNEGSYSLYLLFLFLFLFNYLIIIILLQFVNTFAIVSDIVCLTNNILKKSLRK